MRDDFAVFILTHGRADNIATLNALKNGNYKGKTYFIIDDEDNQRLMYEHNYGKDNVIVFNKQKIIDNTDTMDNFGIHSAIVYARNVTWSIAKELGLNYFLMLDDDYTSIDYRWPKNKKLMATRVPDLDRLFESMIQLLDVTNASTIAFCQGGDFAGGAKKQGTLYYKGMIRKSMNSFFCRTDRPIEYRGTMNEDVVTYTTLGSRGNLFFSSTVICVIQIETQSLEGGMSEEYKKHGTYVKSMYAVMSMPSAIKISIMHSKYPRIHHKISWDKTCPKIISEEWRK